MKIVGIHEAKKHLSKLIEDARNGVPASRWLKW